MWISLRRSLWSCCFIITTALASASAAAESAGGECSVRPWNSTKCCIAEEIGPVTMGNLAVAECDSTSVSGNNHVSLEWDHPTLQEGAWQLSRIFLFSHCINPTNTSLPTLLGTLLYSADRSHLTSSTTTSYPVASVCSYFGCYEGCFGLCRYTFSAVSCTTPNANSMLSSVAPTTLLEVSSLLQTSADSTITVGSTAVIGSSLSTLPGIASQTLATAGQTSIFTETSTAVPTVFTPVPHTFAAPTPVWLWVIIPLLLATLLTVTIFCIIVTIYITRPRDLITSMKGVSWYTDQSTSTAAGKSINIGEMDTLSLHSLHTMYEDMNFEHTQIVQVVSIDQMQEHSTDEKVSVQPPDISTAGISHSSSGVNPSTDIGTHDDSGSMFTTDDSGNASYYVTYRSLNTLFPELNKFQPESSGSS